MIKITPSFSLPDSEFTFDFIRASGPGGQNINKVATAVQLRFDVRNSLSLSEEVKDRLLVLAGKKMTLDGVLIIEAKRYRTQEHNRSDAEKRLGTLIQKAIIRRKGRRFTRPTMASQVRRVETKKRKGEIKRLRRSPDE